MVYLQVLNQEKIELVECLVCQVEVFEWQVCEDVLIGLVNCCVFDEMLVCDFVWLQCSGYLLCLVVFDIDYFKDVND